jgi:DTW domain-containing protein YfiP
MRYRLSIIEQPSITTTTTYVCRYYNTETTPVMMRCLALYGRSRRIIHGSLSSCQYHSPYHHRQVIQLQQLKLCTFTFTNKIICNVTKSRGGTKKHGSLSFCSISFQRQPSNDHDRFIQQIEITINTYVQYYQQTYNINILNNDGEYATSNSTFQCIPTSEREEINIIRYLYDKLRSMKSRNICLRCWYMKPDCCICNSITKFLLPSYIHRIFILTHYKEIGMISDTMKLLLCTYPNHCRLVIGGLFKQHSMYEMMNVLQQNNHKNDNGTTSPTTNVNSGNMTTIAKPLVLFPSANAPTFQTYYDNQEKQRDHCNVTTIYDIIVIDATWDQARRLYNRHMMHQHQPCTINQIPPFTYDNIQLSNASLQSLRQQEIYIKDNENHINPSKITTSSNTINVGQQLRPHPISIRQIATAHAVQLLLHDMITVIETKDSNDKKNKCQDNTNSHHSIITITPANTFSLELHYKQQQMFHQYQELAMNMALRNKQCPTSAR